MASAPTTAREGSLEAPTRHPLDWKNPEFWNEAALDQELERVFDLCHGCRRCFRCLDSRLQEPGGFAGLGQSGRAQD